MSGLSFVPLGVGDAFTAIHFSSSMVVECDESQLLVDCPHPIRRMLRDASLASGRELVAEKLAGVVITHLHADHASGLEGLAYWFHFVAGRRLPVLAHPAVASRLWEGHLAAGMEAILPSPDASCIEKHLSDWIEVVPLDEARPVAFGPFAIECRRTIHHVPTTALRIRAAGRCLAHSADTAFDPALLAWLDEGDLIVHETNHGVHTPYEKLAALPEAMRVKMRLNHYPDEFDAAESVIEALREGDVYDV